jgi:alcohol-forming fatty acyl-CoA reductase
LGAFLRGPDDAGLSAFVPQAVSRGWDETVGCRPVGTCSRHRAVLIIYRVVESPSARERPSIRDALSDKHVLITGVTGFLGAALLERILSELPNTRITVLVRGRYGSPPESRIQEVLASNAFRPLRENTGADGLNALSAERITILEGDVAEGIPELPGDLDVVFHCAASVAFDPPADQAFRVNVLGAQRLYEAVRVSGSRAHLVHVSTAYVAGMRKGVIPEKALQHRAQWKEETEAALASRNAVEAASRRPEMLDRFIERARAEHRRAGPMAVSSDAEERRKSWVNRRLTEYGRARAQTLGWPDVYTFTKALGERVAEDLAVEFGLPLSIVRPSIVESALEKPYPGWIEGFKMAEPIILAYGRGSIPEFPGLPEGVIDIIPVDLVVGAMLAIAATVPGGGPHYYHVSSGARNPLSYLGLYDNVKEYFERHPLPERGRGEVRVPEWRFPGRRQVMKKLEAGEKLLARADRIVSHLPRSNRVRDLVRRVDREKRRLEFVRRYADLYGAYTESEVLYTDDRTLELYRSLAEDDRRTFTFDAAAIDWRVYLQEIHCPSITTAMRVLTPERAAPAVRVVPRHDGVIAVFDMEGTLLDSNVVESYLWLRMAELPREEWPSELAAVVKRLPRYVGADRRDRGEFLRTFYRRYEGASVQGLDRLIDQEVSELVLRRLSPAAVRRIREHRRAGHTTILITGALDCFARPLLPLFDEIVATHLATEDGRYSGYLEIPPLVGEARAAWLGAHADRTGSDLRRSYAYADSHSDLPLLKAVGNPVAVNPDVALYRVARFRRWPIEDWRRIKGTPRVLLPEAMP